jgi:16S rRNA (cytosine1402-N4)-methyltransferase
MSTPENTPTPQFKHIPVMAQEVLQSFVVFNLPSSPGEQQKSERELRYFDGTFGRGGHYSLIKNIFPGLKAVVFDQDLVAIDVAKNQFKTEVQSGNLLVQHANFSQFSSEKWGQFDMMLLDLGVSSPQLDEAARGFSFYHDGPLDMRMNSTQEVTAAMIINEAPEQELIRIFQEYGEVRSPFRVVRALVHDRKTVPFTTTKQLAGLIERVEGWKRKGFHPATLFFQGLRLAVNQELESVENALPKLMEGLKPGGRLTVITFHSLEDRIVKNIFKNSELGKPVHKKVIVPSREEEMSNPRARSAKLRIFERNL